MNCSEPLLSINVSPSLPPSLPAHLLLGGIEVEESRNQKGEWDMEAELSFPQKGAEEPGQPEFCTPPWPTPLLAVPHLTLIPLARSPTVLQAATASGTTTAGNSPVDHVTGRLPSPCCCPAGDLPSVSRLGPTGEVCALACTCVCTEEALAWHWSGSKPGIRFTACLIM